MKKNFRHYAQRVLLAGITLNGAPLVVEASDGLDDTPTSVSPHVETKTYKPGGKNMSIARFAALTHKPVDQMRAIFKIAKEGRNTPDVVAVREAVGPQAFNAALNYIK